MIRVYKAFLILIFLVLSVHLRTIIIFKARYYQELSATLVVCVHCPSYESQGNERCWKTTRSYFYNSSFVLSLNRFLLKVYQAPDLCSPQSGYIPWKKERGDTTVLTIWNVSREWGRIPSLNRSGQGWVPGGQHLSWELNKENEAGQGLREEHFRQGAQQV